MPTFCAILTEPMLDDLINICETYDVEKFRAEQIFNWVYKNKVNDFSFGITVVDYRVMCQEE